MGMAVTLLSVNCLAQNGFTVKPSFQATTPTPPFGTSNPTNSNNVTNNSGNTWANSQSGSLGTSQKQSPYFAQNKAQGPLFSPPLTADNIQLCPANPISSGTISSSGPSCALKNITTYFNLLLWPK